MVLYPNKLPESERVCSGICTVMGKFKKPVFDEVSKCYRIQWSDMAYLTESIVVDKMYVSPKD